MTDYNDGNIHGWNGGQCPVHLNTEVITWADGGLIGQRYARDVAWFWQDGSPRVIAFRVVKAYLDPREWWATGKHLHDSLEEAKAFVSSLSENHPGRGYESTPIVHVREVLE